MDVLGRPKFDRYIDFETRTKVLSEIIEFAAIIEPVESISICRDPKDDMLLELAVGAMADYLVTGDNDLLVLDPFRGTRIVTPRQFLDIRV